MVFPWGPLLLSSWGSAWRIERVFDFVKFFRVGCPGRFLY